MKMKEIKKQLKDSNVAELKKELLASQKEQFNLRMQHATKQLSQTTNLKLVRRKIALINTIMQEKTGQTS